MTILSFCSDLVQVILLSDIDIDLTFEETKRGAMDTPAAQARQVTMRDVALRSGIPLSAVSLALNGRSGVSNSRREKVLAAAAELEYEHRQRQPTATIVGLVMEAISRRSAQDGFMAELVSGVEDGLREHGLKMVLHLCRQGEDPLASLHQTLNRPVDGVILANGGDIDDEVVRQVLNAKIPVVLLENYLQRAAFVHSVVADNFTAGLLSTRHLLELGHRRIGMLVGSTRYVSLRDRRFGYEAALMEAGIVPDRDLMPSQKSGEEIKGYRQMQQLLALADPPTAVYAVSDKSAMGAYQALRNAGLRIPDDMSIVGTDDVHQSRLLDPPLTTYHVPTLDMGRTAASTMKGLIDHAKLPPARTALLGALIERSSTRSISPRG